MHKKIAILAGDGIGPEVMQQALRVLDEVAKKFNYNFEYLSALIGGAAYEKYQSHCPEQTLQLCEQSDAILFGSVGGPIEQQHQPKWQNCETNSILKLRKHFNFNINIRPITVFPALAEHCPLKITKFNSAIDLVIFRELNGGIYFGKHQQLTKAGERIAIDEATYTQKQIVDIAHAAFQAAARRNKKVCSVDKANVLATSQLWREIVTQVATDYPDVALTHILVDNCAMQLVLNPYQFDVILTENMFGDILSDLAAVLPGSLGLIPSASLNNAGKGLYEPSGGSAPDIAGKGIANPCGQILSAALMLRYAFNWHEAAQVIEDAVKNTLVHGIKTADLTFNKTEASTTEQFTNSVIKNISENLLFNNIDFALEKERI
ncbi:MAG: 3-isopropylmalate dehydrogenase [Gammaproteobacteria bacterium]